MTNPKREKIWRVKKRNIIMFCCVSVFLLVVFYKYYLYNNEKDYVSSNFEAIGQIRALENKGAFSFAVFGGAENSIDVFDKKMIPAINNDTDIAFVISAGGAVLSGAEDKYRALKKSLSRLNVPAVVGIGEKEITKFGAMRFYRHFGELHSSFTAFGAYFIFLDLTGQTPLNRQIERLINELDASREYARVFVFLGGDIKNKSADISNFLEFLYDALPRYGVSAVFSTGGVMFSENDINGVLYYETSGGGGKWRLSSPDGFADYHYLKITVSENGFRAEPVALASAGPNGVLKYFENLWFGFHSFFYINFLTFVLILCLFGFFATVVYIRATKEINYYDAPPVILRDTPFRPLNIAMFTNNYFPFVGGVPISISRLAAGLRRLGHNVVIFAPDYPQGGEQGGARRFGLITYHKSKAFEFAIVNIFSPKIKKAFRETPFDIVHVHHPFWMGKKGLSLAQKAKTPVILSYHTRFDMYCHYIPVFKTLFKNIVSHKIVKRFAMQCGAVFAPTDEAVSYLKNIGIRGIVEALPNGVDFSAYNDEQKTRSYALKQRFAPGGEALLCCVARLAREKNIPFLINAARLVKNACKRPFKLLILGDGPEKAQLVSLIGASGLTDVCVLAGGVPPEDVPSYYYACDAFVFSSKTETQGMVLYEAMAAGLPVVSVRASGSAQAVINRENGFLTDENESAFAEKIIYLLENEAERQKMARRAYAHALGFSVDNMAQKASEIYLFLADKNR